MRKLPNEQKETKDGYVELVREWFNNNLFKGFTLSAYEYLLLIQDIIYQGKKNRETEHHSYLILKELKNIGVLQSKDESRFVFA